MTSLSLLAGKKVEAKMHQRTKSVESALFSARKASSSHLGLISDPLMVSKLLNVIIDSKRQAKINLHYTEGQEDVLLPPHSTFHHL